MNKQLIMMIVMLLVINGVMFISAQQTFQQDQPIDLKIQCIINGTYCSGSAFCNVTIQYPNGTLLVNNKGMTNQISFYNYSLPSTSNLGNYLCSATCCDAGFCGTDSDCDYSITPTGDDRGISLFLILIICGFFLFAIDYFVETGYLTFLSGVVFVITGVYSMIYGIGFLSELWTRAIALVSIGVGFIFILGAAYDLVWGEDSGDGGFED